MFVALRSRALVSFLLVGAALAVRPAPAHAAAPNETAGLKRFEDGKHAFEAGQFDVALAAFQDSLTLLPSPNTRLYIARCYRKLGKTASAYTAYRLAMREASDRLNASGEKRYGATRDAASQEGAEIEASVPRLTLAVPSDAPADLAVQVDGIDVPKAAWGTAVETDPGKHAIEAHASRRKPFSAAITLAAGEQKKVDVDVPKLPTGTLALAFKSKPAGMEVSIDGAPADPSTWDQPREVDVGEHVVVVRAPGYVELDWDKPIADGEKAVVEVSLAPQEIKGGAVQTRGTPKWLFFGVAGLSVATAVVGTVVGMGARSKRDDELAKDPLERDVATQDTIRSESTEANVLLVAGGVLAVGAGILAFTTKWHDGSSGETTATHVTPWLGPGTGGFAAKGAF